MASPNLISPTSIIGFTTSVGIGTTAFVGVLTNPASSNKIYKITTIIAANVNGASNVDLSVSILRNGTDRYLAKTIAIPADATQIISAKDTYFYLEENVGIRAQASLADGIDITVSYEEIG